MSVWECGCKIVSDTQGIQSFQVYDHLGACGFKYTRQNLIIPEDFEFLYEDEFHILGALTDMSRNDGEAPCLEISLRFAICNPESVVVVLVEKATKLAQLLNGDVLDDYRNQYEVQNTATNGLLITSLSSDYCGRSRFLKEEMRLQYPIAKRTASDFSQDLTVIGKRRSMPPDGENCF